MIKPKPLRVGGTIGIVAPAGRVVLSDLQRGIVWLEQLGYRVILGKCLEKRDRYFAGTDQERADDLLEMFQNKEVNAIFCARGGYGSARVISHLDGALLHSCHKIFVGCSDITALLLYFFRKFGWVTFHGPMVATPFGPFGQTPSTKMEGNLWNVLAGETIEMRNPGVQVLRLGMAAGLLTGGCLTLICHTIGTPYEIDTTDKILFLEDTDEAPYRIDRMLSYLKTIGKLDAVRGLVLGQMPGCRPEELPEIILEILHDFSFPILFGFPSGHGDSLATLPFGTLVQIEGTSLKMCEPACV